MEEMEDTGAVGEYRPIWGVIWGTLFVVSVSGRVCFDLTPVLTALLEEGMQTELIARDNLAIGKTL